MVPIGSTWTGIVQKLSSDFAAWSELGPSSRGLLHCQVLVSDSHSRTLSLFQGIRLRCAIGLLLWSRLGKTKTRHYTIAAADDTHIRRCSMRSATVLSPI
ncbi:hypothetical protein PMIN06_000483 [Paraphaeosphaeria minitans]